MIFPRHSVVVLLAAALSASNAWAQRRGQDDGSRYRTPLSRAGAMNTPPRLITASRNYRAPLATFDSRGRGAFSTRIDQMRAYRPTLPSSLLSGPKRFIPPSPIKQMLDRRNLLAPRSPLARTAAAHLGRLDYVPDAETGVMAGDVSAWPAPADPSKVPSTLVPDDGRFQDTLGGRLAREADAYFEKAVEAFRNGNFSQARQYFELVGVIERDRPRAKLGAMFASFQSANVLQASLQLLLALDRTKTADDLRFDKDLLYTSAEFQRTLDAVTIWVRKTPDRPEPHLVLAYFAWLNGDLVTAREAIGMAEKKMPPYWNAEPVRRFRDIIREGAGTAAAAK